MEDEISYLIEKLNELKSPKVKDMEARSCRHNFDKQASVLRKELERFDEAVSEEVCVKGIQKMAEASFLVNSDQSDLRNNNGNVSVTIHCKWPKSFSMVLILMFLLQMDTLSSKMEALSKGVLLERMEKEYGLSHFAPSSSSVSKCIDRQDASVQDMYNKVKLSTLYISTQMKFMKMNFTFCRRLKHARKRKNALDTAKR